MIPADFEPSAILPVGQEALIVGGGPRGVGPVAYHVGPAGVTPSLDGPGVIVAADRCGDDIVGVLVRPDGERSAWRLLRGSFDGLAEVGAAPAAVEIRALPDRSIWALGPGFIARSDGGAFVEVAPPSPAVPGLGRLLRAGDRLVFAAPEGLFLARDGGARWGRRHVDGAHVRALSGNLVAARRGHEVHFGRLDGAFVEWGGRLSDPADPLALWVGDGAVVLVALPDDPARHPGAVLVRGVPGEARFETTLVRVPPTPGRIAIGADGAVWALAAHGEIVRIAPC